MVAAVTQHSVCYVHNARLRWAAVEICILLQSSMLPSFGHGSLDVDVVKCVGFSRNRASRFMFAIIVAILEISPRVIVPKELCIPP